MLQKISGQPFESEVPRPAYDRVTPAPRIEDISRATIALVTDGGLVPKGNPDRIETRTATRFGRYSFKGQDALNGEDYEVSHLGYDSVFVRQDPNRLVPVDVMRQLEKEGVVGKLHEEFYSTTGVANIVETMSRLGKQMAEQLQGRWCVGGDPDFHLRHQHALRRNAFQGTGTSRSPHRPYLLHHTCRHHGRVQQNRHGQ